MEISDELISHLESLAHIELDTDEREDCRRDFEKIIYGHAVGARYRRR